MAVYHVADNGKHVEEIDERLRELAAAVTEAGTAGDIDEMLLIIHRPPFTTPQDIAFIHELINAAERSAENTRLLRRALLDGVRAVSEASRAAA